MAYCYTYRWDTSEYIKRFTWGGSDDYYNSVMVRRSLQVGVGTEDIATGKIGTWTSDKTLQYRIAKYSSHIIIILQVLYIIGNSDGSYQPPTFELIQQ